MNTPPAYSDPAKNIPYMDTNTQYNNFQQQQQQVPDGMPSQMAMFAQPMVQDMAIQYGAQVIFYIFFNVRKDDNNYLKVGR